MEPREAALLLLCCRLGDEAVPLTAAEYRQLAQRVQQSTCTAPETELTSAHLRALGYDAPMRVRILTLLDRREHLCLYLGAHPELRVMTRIYPCFPQSLRRLGDHCPAALFLKGDPALLQRPCVSLVGSRRIAPDNRAFAEAVGQQAAREGYVLVSGGAAGADRAAQAACLRAGGSVICVVPDALTSYPNRSDVLYCSDEGYEFVFSAARALRRNGIIHALGEKTFVAQSDVDKGGTWAGTTKNLRHGLSEVYAYADGSEAAARFQAMGATLLPAAPAQIGTLRPAALSIFDLNLQDR